jgi:two-component system, NtrC family, C4-dicarboxylate transport sensor histidine kinase DctB
MLRNPLRQLGLFLGAVAAIGLSALATQKVWRENGLKSLQAVNEQRVQLVANAVKAEVGRQDHLPFVLSVDPDVREALAHADDPAHLESLSRKLARVSQEAETRGLYVIAPDGKVLAGSDWQSPETLVGRNVADRPYFVRAVESGRSTYLGVEPESTRVRYYLAEAIRDSALRGVAVVRIEFDPLEQAWEQAGERVLVTDRDGIVFLASGPGYKYRFLSVGGAPMRASSDSHKHYPGALSSAIDAAVIERRGPDSVVRVNKPEGGNTDYLYQALPLPQFGWTIHRLTDLTPVNEDRRDGGIIGATLAALILSLLLYMFQRHRAYVAAREAGDRLKRDVADRTRELSASNASLQTEIDEHRRTEARLRAAQNELVQAGKLAALGQMSAAIAHEINQPLAAIRTFVASTKIFAERGDLAQVTGNLQRVNSLAERMANITAHLKTFARKSEPGRADPVSVERAIDGALFLMESQIAAAGVRIEKDVEADLYVLGYAVQLEQVILNLVHNALDAVPGVRSPCIRVTARASADTVTITVADNGPGIPPERIGQIFDPFFTTKAVGRGLGLGLSISYGIVQDFGGRIRAANGPDGGAELVIELPRHLQEAAPSPRAVHA